MAIYEELMGNPFVDAGVSAICEWLKKEPNKIDQPDLIEMMDTFAPIMCKQEWLNKLMFIFTIGGKATNPSFKGNVVARLMDHWKGYLTNIEELGFIGDCLGCGRRKAKFSLIKMDVPLTGSGNLLNFFPLFDKGIGYCAACALAIQFLPLALIASGGKFLMVHSNSERVQRYWVRLCLDDIRRQILRNEVTGCFNPGYKNPHNGLFAMTQELMSRYEARWSAENAVIQLYHFTNDNRSPWLNIYQLPAEVFKFLAYVYERQFQSAWKEIVKSGYRKVKWDEIQSEDEYKNKYNLVYEWLLEGRSILGFFLNRSERQVRGDWELVTLYLREVYKMNESRLETLKRVGENISDSIKQSGNTKRLGQMERTVRYAEFRNVLLRIIRDRISQGQGNPLFSLDEYMMELFPETAGEFTDWRETKDLLLFCIYETLHDWLKSQELSEVVEEPEEETEE